MNMGMTKPRKPTLTHRTHTSSRFFQTTLVQLATPAVHLTAPSDKNKMKSIISIAALIALLNSSVVADDAAAFSYTKTAKVILDYLII